MIVCQIDKEDVPLPRVKGL